MEKMNIEDFGMNREKLSEMFVSGVSELADGNIGAMSFVFDTLNIEDDNDRKNMPLALARAKHFGIVGSKLYLLWNDCCNKDTSKTLRVLVEESKESLFDHIDVESRCDAIKFE